jgi:hypothetical protein
MGVVRLDVYSGEDALFSRQFEADSITIGSGPEAMMRVVGSGLASLHAVITIGEDKTARLIGIGAGCRINDRPAHAAALQAGDRIGLGDEISLVFTPAIGEEAALEERTAPAMVLPSDVEASRGDDVLSMLMRWGTARGDAGIDRSGDRVLEVAEVWGDTIVDVKHYDRGADAVTIGGVTGHRWRVLGKPIAWVPPAFARIAWAAAPMLSEASEEWRSDFYAPTSQLPHDHFSLFTAEGGRWVCNFSEKWTGFIDQGEERRSLAELVASGEATAIGAGLYRVCVTEDSRILMDTGEVIFFGQLTWPGRRIVASMVDNIDYPFAGVMAFMVFVLAMISTLIYSSPIPASADVIAIPDRFAEVVLSQPEPEPVRPPTASPSDEPDPLDEGAVAKDEEGKVGKTDAKMKMAKGKKVEIQKQELDREVATEAGVLGVIGDNSALSGVFGSASISADLVSGVGGLLGSKGNQQGTNGLGSRGTGLGGGGAADSLGGLGTRGRGGGDAGYGNQPAAGPRPEGDIGGIGGTPIIVGALDRSLIDAVIKRHMNQFRYCYQRELNKDPGLAGKVTVKFVIAGNGSVSRASIKKSTLGNDSVESCLSGRFMTLQFPEPKGNGIVIVSYPFMFAGS